jgi:putative FmdB family regulatory protein
MRGGVEREAGVGPKGKAGGIELAMPTYDYECLDPDCSHNWEQEQSIKDDPERVCPKCKAETAKRVIAGCNFTLKGGRWGSTGYK